MDTMVSECATSLARAELYSILAGALAGPEGSLEAARYRDFGRIAADVPVYATLTDEAPALEALVRELSEDPRRVVQEYTRLFHKARAPPYETSYMASVRMTRELADVSAFFRAFGLQSRGERPDYLVSELELMSVLCLKESLAAGADKTDQATVCREAQAKFIQDHLGRWIGAYRSRLEAEATMPLYPRVVGLAQAFVRIDAHELGVDPEELREVAPRGDEEAASCGPAR